jgi:hypothetical protein
VPDVARALDALRVQLDPSQPEHLAIELRWERLDPLSQFLGNELLKDLCERVSGANVLIAGRFINKCDDSDLGETSKQDLGLRDRSERPPRASEWDRPDGEGPRGIVDVRHR